MFPKDAMLCAYKRFPNLKDLMVRYVPYSIKPLKEIDQDPLPTIHHLLKVLQQNKFLKSEYISHELHQI